jgi:NADH-quinone oxidoreductase subunit H
MEYGSLAFQAVAATIKIVFMILGFLMPLASILTWMERRESAMMQDRLGPNRANIGPIKLWGITHFMADAVKFLFKRTSCRPRRTSSCSCGRRSWRWRRR